MRKAAAMLHDLLVNKTDVVKNAGVSRVNLKAGLVREGFERTPLN